MSKDKPIFPMTETSLRAFKEKIEKELIGGIIEKLETLSFIDVKHRPEDMSEYYISCYEVSELIKELEERLE